MECGRLDWVEEDVMVTWDHVVRRQETWHWGHWLTVLTVVGGSGLKIICHNPSPSPNTMSKSDD